MLHLWCLIVLNIILFCSTNSSDANKIPRRVSAKTLMEKIMSTFMTRPEEAEEDSDKGIKVNLSNLFLVMLIKAFLYAAGTMGSTGFSVNMNRAEYSQEKQFISDTEVLFYLGYLSGSKGNYTCLENIACHRPQQALQYAKLGGLLVTAAKVFPNIVKVNPEHEKIVIDLRKAVKFGSAGKDCNAQYECLN